MLALLRVIEDGTTEGAVVTQAVQTLARFVPESITGEDGEVDGSLVDRLIAAEKKLAELERMMAPPDPRIT